MSNTLIAAPSAVRIRRATASEIPHLAEVLALAFYDDPSIQWLIPDDSRRMAIGRRSFEFFLRKLWFPQGECYTTDGVVGAAVWERPGEWQVGILTQLRLLPAMTAIYGHFLPRLMRAITALESNHPHEPHYYLPFIGVRPDSQGSGVGSALAGPILERCDGERVPAYLEATTPRNRALYERHGFEVTEEFTLGKDSPPLWRMWRKPTTGPATGSHRS